MKKLCKSIKQAKNFNAQSILRHVMHEVLGLDFRSRWNPTIIQRCYNVWNKYCWNICYQHFFKLNTANYHRRPMQDYIIKIYNDFSYLRVWVLLETRGNRTLPEIYHLHNTLEPCKMMTIVPWKPSYAMLG